MLTVTERVEPPAPPPEHDLEIEEMKISGNAIDEDELGNYLG